MLMINRFERELFFRDYFEKKGVRIISVSTLKSMENGSIGEARTKELLIDRFWILERSVDVQGADFIIQRKSNELIFYFRLSRNL